MLRLLLFLSILHIALCSCPDGFELIINGQCRESKPFYALGGYNGYKIIDTAITGCNQLQAEPVIIQSDEEQAYWKNHTERTNYYIVLGLVCNSTSKKWQWVDGSAVGYIPPEGLENGGLTNADCKSDGSWVIWTGENGNKGKWYLFSDSAMRNYEVYCIKQLQQPVLPSIGCYSFEDDYDDNVCYQIGSAAENWQDAQMICKQFGANLASIHNNNENSFIRRLAVSKGAVHGVFLGATTSGKGANYGWIDGSDWDYNNFYPGFPMSVLGDCIAMDTSISSGQWMNVECSAQLPVACTRELKTAEWNATCEIHTWEEGAIITSPGFPFNASIPCDYFLTVDVGKKVEVEIALLEANSCCDFLVLNDGYFGGYVIANLTGEIQNKTYTTTDSNIMKVSWQPNGGVNVRGMAITFRGV